MEGQGGPSSTSSASSSSSFLPWSFKSSAWRERGSKMLRFGRRLSSTSLTGSKVLGLAIAAIVWIVLMAGLWEGNAEWKNLIHRHEKRLGSSLCKGSTVEETRELLQSQDCAESIQIVKTRWFSYVVFYAVGKTKHVFFPDVSGDSTFIFKQKLVEMVNSQNLFLVCITILAYCYYRPNVFGGGGSGGSGTSSSAKHV